MRPASQQAAAAFRSNICVCHLIAPPLGRPGYALVGIICYVCKKVNDFCENSPQKKERAGKPKRVSGRCPLLFCEAKYKKQVRYLGTDYELEAVYLFRLLRHLSTRFCAV